MTDMDNTYIRSVKQDRKSRKLYHLFEDAEEPFLTVHEDIFIRFRMMKGQTLSKQQLVQIAKEDSQYRAYITAIAYLGTKPRTSKQIKQYLTRKELEQEYIEYAVKRLSEEGLVDDEGYARDFAAGRLRSNLKGRMLINQELRQRGVSKQAAADAIAELTHEEELEAALTAGQKKWRTLKGEAIDRKRKLTGYLLRRGFPSPIVREVLRELQQEDDELALLEDDGHMLDN